MAKLTTHIHQLHLNNPFIPASGCFGYGMEFQNLFGLDEWGAVLTKTITMEKREGNPPPRLYETSSGLLNSIGLANPGVADFKTSVYPHYVDLNVPLIISIAGNTSEDYLSLVEELNPLSRIQAFEINISCPNTKKGGLSFGVDPLLIRELIQQIKAITPKTVLVKLTPNVTDIGLPAIAAQEGGADGLVIANTYLGMAIDITRQKPVFQNIQAGLSGPAIKPMALLKVFQVYTQVSIPIIAVGGISNLNDVIEFLMAGACAIQLGTILFREPAGLPELKKQLLNYLEDHHYTSLQNIIGTAHRS